MTRTLIVHFVHLVATRDQRVSLRTSTSQWRLRETVPLAHNITPTLSDDPSHIGSPAKAQLVKNAKSTIVGFRNLLGKKFFEIPQSQSTNSAPVIQYPELSDEPAYKVEILQPAPAPLPKSTTGTPAASSAPTPRSEPIPAERILTVSEVTTIFLKSLLQSAEDFLGKKVQGAVITVPSIFTDAQKDALEKAAADAGIIVYQSLEEPAAVAATTTTEAWSLTLAVDRTQLVVDIGSSSLPLSPRSSIGGDAVDSKLTTFFATEFTKKTKPPLTVCSEKPSVADARAEAKLRLSLKDGVDFTSSINRLRFDMLVRPIYDSIAQSVADLLDSVKVDPHHVDEIVYVGGTTCLPGLDEHLCLTAGFNEDINTPFSMGTVIGGGIEDEELKKAFERNSELTEVKTTSKILGLVFPDESRNELGGTWIPLVPAETVLPTRRTATFDIGLSEQSKRFAFEFWEVSEGIRVEKVVPPKGEAVDDEDEEEEEEVEVKHKTLIKEALIGVAEAQAALGIQVKGPSKEAGKWTTTVEATIIVDASGAVDVTVKEIGKDGAVAIVKAPAP
ncbi:hypothetical protein BT96DRAFT_1025940 [Gymnopus androsaceus JB14]|uniref:Actin-like ATPase domain-containing protein n=1 Tax=Gymnopus androsaceus JB14 TaxID=1447944 RepID=A0A6A4GPG6_9AGAR|nr:hypothetical protein BT96DRAFT_1025940 [Gymnopus androsaceus JB14]